MYVAILATPIYLIRRRGVFESACESCGDCTREQVQHPPAEKDLSRSLRCRSGARTCRASQRDSIKLDHLQRALAQTSSRGRESHGYPSGFRPGIVCPGYIYSKY